MFIAGSASGYVLLNCQGWQKHLLIAWRSRAVAAQTFDKCTLLYSNRTRNLTKCSATAEIARDADYVDFSVDDEQ